ncbi:MAG: AAA family ATPase [Polyangiales bacterium]
MSDAGLYIRLLGEPELTLAGKRLTLPPSKKTRALLGYLALSERAHRRERLCGLLWDVADDPRAALRWSLSKLRELVDADGKARLIADREHVRLDLSDAWLDVAEARTLARARLCDVSTDVLESALALFRGELLEGLELADFHAYHAFCVSEREALRDLHARIVAELLERAEGRPDEALPLARRLVELDPSSEAARTQFLALLAASGREREVLVEARNTSRLLAPPSPAVRAAAAVEAPRESLAAGAAPEMIGRSNELSRVTDRLPARDGGPRVVLITGAPGLGKSCLLQQVLRAAQRGSMRCFEGAAHEVELGFAYAPLRALLVASQALPADVPGQSQPPAGSASLGEAQSALFHGVAQWLCSAVEAGPVLLALEDLHWFDEGSAVLLHHLVRASSGRPLCVVATARAGELADNAPVRRLLRALRGEGVLEELALAPLSSEETAALVRRVSSDADAALVHADSGGNPLFALALARSPARASQAVPTSITQLVRERMESLGSEPHELLRWASVLGETFTIDALVPLLGLPAADVVESLEQLERLGWIGTSGAAQAQFAHAVVHRAVYDALSGPRRRLMHGRVAELLAQGEADEPRVAALAHHAVLGGNAEMAVRACLAAARRCLRLYAAGDAMALARRGLEHVFAIAQPARCQLEIELRELLISLRRGDPDAQMLARLPVLAGEAIAIGEVGYARRCFFMHALMLWEAGQLADARAFSLEAERCNRLGTPRERLRGLADAAGCLCVLERDLAEAEAFILEAEALIDAGEPDDAMVRCIRGLLDSLRGEWDAADRTLAHAYTLAREQGDHITSFGALEYRVEIALARGDWEAALPLVETLSLLGERTREGSERPFAHALHALVQVALGRLPDEALHEPLTALRHADSKRRSAYVLVRWAELTLARKDRASARARAEEALALALQIENLSEQALARAVLVRTADDRAEAHRTALGALYRARLSMRARLAVAGALQEDPAGARQPKEKHGNRDRRARVR